MQVVLSSTHLGAIYDPACYGLSQISLWMLDLRLCQYRIKLKAAHQPAPVGLHAPRTPLPRRARFFCEIFACKFFPCKRFVKSTFASARLLSGLALGTFFDCEDAISVRNVEGIVGYDRRCEHR